MMRANPRSLTMLPVLAVLLLAGCGFQLQGRQGLSPRLATVQVVAADRHSDFTRALRRSLDASGARLAKRTDALALAALRSEGVDPRAIVAWAARASGQASPERALPSDLLRTFDLALLPCERIAFTPADHASLRLQRI